VAVNIGGMYENFKTYDQDGPVYEMVPEERQREAMAWMQRQVFATPDWLVNQEVLRRIEGVGAIDRIRRYQVGAVNTLLDPQRMAPLSEAEVMIGNDTYTCTEMLSDLREGIWSELDTGTPIDAFRRNLQRGYVERLEYLMTEEPGPVSSFLAAFGYTNLDVSQSDIRAYVRGELETLQRDVDRNALRTSDRMTRLHLRDISARITDILNGEE
jgi:hypothetical protein